MGERRCHEAPFYTGAKIPCAAIQRCPGSRRDFQAAPPELLHATTTRLGDPLIRAGLRWAKDSAREGYHILAPAAGTVSCTTQYRVNSPYGR